MASLEVLFWGERYTETLRCLEGFRWKLEGFRWRYIYIFLLGIIWIALEAYGNHLVYIFDIGVLL